MAKTFRSLNQLGKYVEKQIDDTMYKDMGEKVKEVQVKNIQQYVYGTYIPIRYKRRKSSGGLMDKRNMRKSMQYLNKGQNRVMRLGVVNMTKPSNAKSIVARSKYSLSHLIEFGDNYIDGLRYDFPRRSGRFSADLDPFYYSYLLPRSFTEATIIDMHKNALYINVLRKGLMKRGLDCMRIIG